MWSQTSCRGPGCQWIDLDQAELRVALDGTRPGARGSLVSANGGDQRSQTDERFLQGLDLEQTAAVVWLAFPQTVAELSRLQFQGK